MSLLHFKTVLAGDLAAKGMTALFTIAVVRLLAPDLFADYVLLSALVVFAATSFSGFFNRYYILTALGPTTARSYRRWQVVASGAAFTVSGALLASDRDGTTLFAGLVCTLAAAAFDFSRTHAQKETRFARYAVAEFVRVAILLPISLAILFTAHSNTVALLLGAQALSYAVAVFLLPRLPGESIAGEKPSFVALLSEPSAWHLVAYFVLLGLFGQLPVLMLNGFGSQYELASFGSAVRYYGLALAIVVAANVVVLPQLSTARDSAELLVKLAEIKPIVFGALAMLAVIAVGGYIVIPYLDGGKYPAAPILFFMLCSALIPGILLAPITAAFFRLGWFAHLLGSLVLANIVCALTALVFSRWGPYAAAAALPAAVTAQLAVLLLVFRWRRERIAR